MPFDSRKAYRERTYAAYVAARLRLTVSTGWRRGCRISGR